MKVLDFGMSFSEAARDAKPECATCGGKKGEHPGMVQSGSDNGTLHYIPCSECFSESKAETGRVSLEQYLRGGDTD